jgi:aldose 1-epimerase
LTVTRVDVIGLETERFRLTLLPELGARIAACRWRHPDGRWLELIRPMSFPYDGDEEAGCFPLTPFSNRLRDGRFTFAGRDIQMPRNTPGPHVEHGHGWQRAWTVAARGPGQIILRYEHAGDAWPFPYAIEQAIELLPDRLRVTLTAHNRGAEPLPYGFGLHPFFPATPETTLEARVESVWHVDDEVMPTRLGPASELWGSAPRLVVSETSLDTAFAGWDGAATIRWPELGAGLSMAADAPLRHLVVYTPPGASHFCAEPVSHCTDAFNLAETRNDTGMVVLAPGETLTTAISLSPFALP